MVMRQNNEPFLGKVLGVVHEATLNESPESVRERNSRMRMITVLRGEQPGMQAYTSCNRDPHFFSRHCHNCLLLSFALADDALAPTPVN
jgi:hypothetical protein